MDPLKVSAQFAAYVWFTGREEHTGRPNADALQFARENWVAFLPCGHEGCGRLLLRIAGPRLAKQRLPQFGSGAGH